MRDLDMAAMLAALPQSMASEPDTAQSDSDGAHAAADSESAAGTIPTGMVRHHADPEDVEAKARAAERERSEAFEQMHIDPASLAVCSPGAADSTWEAALSEAWNPVSSTYITRRVQLHEAGTSMTLSNAVLLGRTVALPILKGSHGGVDSIEVCIEDQGGRLLHVQLLAKETWREFGGDLATFAQHIDRRFARGTSLALRQPIVTIGERGFGLAVSFDEDNVWCLGALELPAKTASQYASEARAFEQTSQADPLAHAEPRTALALVMDGLKEAHREGEGLLVALLQNLAAAELSLGNDVVALAWCVAAWRLLFPECPPKAALRAAQVLHRLEAYQPAIAMLFRVRPCAAFEQASGCSSHMTCGKEHPLVHTKRTQRIVGHGAQGLTGCSL
jgi:hypothetical protein